MHRSHRVAGALVGSAAGDALGALFEFGPAGAFSARFPVPARGARTEVCGGGSLGWAPGGFTDGTQMALLVAGSLLEHDGLDEADLSGRFARWAEADPPGIGRQTRARCCGPANRGTTPRPSTWGRQALRRATAR